MGVSRPFAVGLGLGALVSPIAQLLATRYSGRHWLDITTKENQ